MSERMRNNLYYIERMMGDGLAIHPDGTFSRIEEEEIEVDIQVPGRKEGTTRTVKDTARGFAQIGLTDNLARYVVEYEDRVKRAIERYSAYGSDESWSIDDMPDTVLANFSKWKENIALPTTEELVEAASAKRASTSELLDSTVVCPECNGGHNSKYACRGCGYSGKYYEYPLVRVYDSEGTEHDVPFDVSRFIETNPDAVSYNLQTKFDYKGNLSAEQKIVLDTKKVHASFLNSEEASHFRIDEADALYGNIELTISAWHEKNSVNKPKAEVDSIAPDDIIDALQLKCAVKIAKETTEAARYGELYDKFVDKLRSMGRAGLTAIIFGVNEGMGDYGYRLWVNNNPESPHQFEQIGSHAEVRWLIEDALDDLALEQENSAYSRQAVKEESRND